MEILVIFKTHLDLGYTDLAKNVEKRYMTEFIPHALDLAEATKDSDERFVWTTGSWLVTRFLETSPDAPRMERAIRDGLISWHALPFTMHKEMMDAPLYEYGLSLSKRLDERFGKKTTAAKCTDVPGFTKAAVPLLAKAGVKLIHIGVNPVSAVPEVPPVFRWRVGDSEIIVIYDKTYGEITALPGTDKLLCFAMTNDNCGPQSPDDIKAFYDELRQKYPDAKLRAATLNDAAEALMAANPELPIFEGEIGDSWAHGYQSDPRKQSVFRSLLRTAAKLPESQRDCAYSELLKVAEHTCGLCGSRYIDDDGSYCRPDFELMRKNGRYALAESSWDEQREYTVAAADALEQQGIVTDCLSEWRTAIPTASSDRLTIGKPFELGRFTLTVGADGALSGLMLDGQPLCESWRRFFCFEYELFSYADTMRFGKQYFKNEFKWGYDDFTKPGLDESPNTHILAGAHAVRLFRRKNSVVCHMSCEPILNEKYGCPKLMTLTLTAEEDRLCVDFAWFDKPALRIPEGIWLRCDGGAGELAAHKLGMWVDPRETVRGGGRSLHGTDYGARFGGFEIETLDCSLLSFGAGLWDYSNRNPIEGDPVRFCLYNNQWNTNFPFWYEDDARFRFVLTKAER